MAELPSSPSFLLPADPEAEETTMLYVIYYHNEVWSSVRSVNGQRFYTIHAIDINKDHHQPHNHHLLPDPILVLPTTDCPHGLGFGHLGSSIYLVGGLAGWSSRLQPSVDVYIIDTECLLSSTNTARQSPGFLRMGPQLNFPKWFNPIVLTIRGKLYVINRCFDPENKKENPGACAEYLDPKSSNAWVALPQPVHAYADIKDYTRGRRRPFDVVSYGVVGSILVLQLACELAYELDSNNPDQGWKLSSKSDDRLSGLKGSNGSENVDGLLFPWFRTRGDQPKSLVTYDVTQQEGSYKPVPLCLPKQRKKGSYSIDDGESRVADCGGGEAVIFTSGFDDLVSDGFRKLYFNVEVVSLEKSSGGRKRSRHDAGGTKTPQHVINCIPRRSSRYLFGEVDRYGYLCACFAIGMPMTNIAQGSRSRSRSLRDAGASSSITLSLRDHIMMSDEGSPAAAVRMGSRFQQLQGRTLAALRELARERGLPEEYSKLKREKLLAHLVPLMSAAY